MQSVVLILSCVAVAVTAVTLESTFLNTFISNGTQGNETQWRQKTLTFSCSNTSPRDPNLLIGNFSYDINCQPPQYLYRTILRQFIPHELRRYTAEYCEVDTLVNLAPSGTQGNTGGSSTGRRLLSVNQGQRKLMDAQTDCIKAATSIKDFENCGGKSDSTYSCSGTGAGSSGCPPWITNGCTGLSGPDCFTSYVKSQDFTLASMATWFQGQQIFDTNQASVVTDLHNSLELQLQQFQQQQNGTEQLALAIQSLANATQARYDSISSQFDNQTRALQSQLGIDLALSAQEQQLENYTTTNFLRLIATSQLMAGNISDNFFTMISQNRQAVQLLRGMEAVKSKAVAKIGVRRGLTTNVFNLINTAKAAGLTPFLDPTQAGSAPGPPLAGTQKVFVDVQYLNMINSSGSGPIVHQYTIGYYCNVQVVIDDFLAGVTWTDLIEQLGPFNCTKLPGSTVDNCHCWLEIHHDTCPANTAPNDALANDFDWQQITTRSNIAAYNLKGNPSYCLGSGGARTTPGPWDGRLIDDVRIWDAFLGQLCASYPLADQTAGLHSSGSRPRQQQLVSTRVGILNLDKPSNIPLTCAPNYDYVFQVAPVENNLVFSIYTLWTQAQALLLSDQYTYETQVHGVLPNYLTFEELPFELLSNNKTYTCHRASFVAVSSDTRPVFEVIPEGVETFATANSYATEPVCDNTGCVFGTPVSTQTTASAVASVPFDFLLPDGSDTIIGEWRTHGIPTMTTVFDAPTGAGPINNVNSNRKGKLTYTWQPIPDGYNITTQTSFSDSLPAPLGPWPQTTLMDKWNALNPLSFNAIDAQFSLDFTEIGFANGHCQTSSSNVPEWACNMFDQFSIGAQTDMRKKGLLVLIPSVWNYILTVNIVEGEILQRVFPGCPEIGFTSFTSGYQQVTLTNSLPSPITVVLRTTNLSPLDCPSVGDKQFSMLPKQTQTSFVLPCGHQLLTVYQLTSAGALSACSNALNITFDQSSQANVAMFTSATTNRSIVDDAIQAQLARAQIQALNFLNALVPLVSETFTPDLTAPQRSSAIDSLFAAQNASLLALYNAASTVNTQSAQEAIKPYIDAFNTITVNLNDVNAQEQALQKKLGDDVAAVQRDAVFQGAQTNATVSAITNQIAISKDYLNQVNSAQSSTAQCNWCGSSIVGSLPGLCGIICSILTVLIGIAPFLLIGVAVLLFWKYCRKPVGSAVSSAFTPTPAAAPAETPAKKPDQGTKGRYAGPGERDEAELSPLLRVP